MYFSTLSYFSLLLKKLQRKSEINNLLAKITTQNLLSKTTPKVGDRSKISGRKVVGRQT